LGWKIPCGVIGEGLQSAMRADELIIAQCRAKPDVCASPAALSFIAVIKEARQYEGFSRIGHINRAVNLSMKAKGIGNNWVLQYPAYRQHALQWSIGDYDCAHECLLG
jgi:hypothetical protein